MNAYVFPGQGSQFPGMAKDIYGSLPKAKEMLEKANEILGFRITDIMFEGTSDDLKATKVTQPAIFLHSTVLAECYKELGQDRLAALGLAPYGPDMVAGHSLGEFSALAVSGAMRFEDALRLVALRAREMQKCCESVPGIMAAIIGLPTETVESLCNEVEGLVVPANYNCDGQVVVSGEKEAVDALCARAKEAGAKRALPLAVSGAFHSPLMQPAAEELGKAIAEVEIVRPSCPVYQNVSAHPETDPEVIKANLLAQLTSPVKWTQSVKNMLVEGADNFIEIGPGTVLQGLVKRISGGMVNIAGLSTL
ncbi:MAG: ACP S-malonyltransferase [Candidatus Cryptobacteroides sp.]